MLVDNKITINSKEFEILPINARSVEISTEDSFIEYKKDPYNGKRIQAISLGGSEKFTFTIGDEIKVKIVDTITEYRVNYIYQANPKRYQLTEENLNKSSTFLFPALGENKIIWKTEYLINCFIPEGRNDRLHLLYRFVGSDNFSELEQRILTSKYYIKTEELDKYRTKYIFKIPDENMADVDLFLKGKYSKLSENLKFKIINFHQLNKKSNLYKILYKSKELREELEKELGVELDGDCELYSIPNYRYEVVEDEE